MKAKEVREWKRTRNARLTIDVNDDGWLVCVSDERIFVNHTDPNDLDRAMRTAMLLYDTARAGLSPPVRTQ